MKKILSIDGGGIRGIIPARILMRLEEDLGAPLNNYIDLVAGTSTGGIIAASIAAGKPMNEVVDLYLEEGVYIFQKKWYRGLINSKYPDHQIDLPLEEHFANMKLVDLKIDFLTTAFNITDGKPRFFSKRGEGPMFVRDVLRATTAAPTYFNPAVIGEKEYADGGLFATSPTMCAYAEAKSLYKKSASEMFVLSIGTCSKVQGYENASKWHKFKWITPLIDSLMSSDAGVTHYQLMQIYKSINLPGNYFRINGNLPDYIDSSMDNNKRENIQAMLEFADELYDQQEKKIKKILHALQ